ETIDAMVDAIAGVGERLEAADLDLIGAAVAGADTEGAKQRPLRLQGGNPRDLRLPPPPPQRDLLLIRGPPALGARWSAARPTCPTAHTAVPRRSRAGSVRNRGV